MRHAWLKLCTQGHMRDQEEHRKLGLAQSTTGAVQVPAQFTRSGRQKGFSLERLVSIHCSGAIKGLKSRHGATLDLLSRIQGVYPRDLSPLTSLYIVSYRLYRREPTLCFKLHSAHATILRVRPRGGQYGNNGLTGCCLSALLGDRACQSC